MNEKLIEKKLRERAKKMGGIALKFLPYFWVGAPDRIILMPKGRVYWVETKSTSDDLMLRQQTRKKFLEKLGFKVFKIDSQESLDLFFEEVKEDAI